MKNGGPAFPAIHSIDGNWVKEPLNEFGGMSLRDYFAAAALSGGLEQGIEHDMASAMPDVDNWWHPESKIARRAYAIADAMIAEREKP